MKIKPGDHAALDRAIAKDQQRLSAMMNRESSRRGGPVSSPTYAAAEASQTLAKAYQGSAEERFRVAYLNKDYESAIRMIHNRDVTPDSVIVRPTKDIIELTLKQFIFNHHGEEDASKSRANSYAGVIDAILKSDFTEKEEFETRVAGMGLSGRLDVLEAALDNGVRMKGRTFTSVLLPTAPNSNAMLGWSCYGFDNYSDEKRKRLGTLVARVEKAGGGTFTDFDAGIRRRNEWVESVRDVINGGILIAAYAAAGGVLHVGDSVATGVKRTVRDGLASTPAPKATPDERQADVRRTYVGSSTRDFQVTWFGNGVANHELVLRDVKTGFRIWVEYHGATGVISGNRLKGDLNTLVGTTVNVKFNSDGSPDSVARNSSGTGLCDINNYDLR